MSLRARLLTAMAIISVLLVSAAVIVTRITREDLVERVDRQLLAAVSDGGRFGSRWRPPPEIFGGGASNFSVFVVDADTGRELYHLRPDYTTEDLPEPDLESLPDDIDGKPFTVPAESGGAGFRAIARQLAGGDFSGNLVVVALPLDDVEASMSRLIKAEVVATVAILSILALVTWWVLRLGVRPVKQMTASAAAIADGDMSHRVPTAPEGTEAGALGIALNRMLDQIEKAFAGKERSEQQLRQFVADASHELRTPVATVRGYAELYRTGGLEDRERLDDAMRRSEQEAERMSRLVDDLLLLARLDQGRPLEQAPVRLDEIADDVARDARVREPDRAINFNSAGAVTVVGDESRLRQVLTNLVSNALVHTPADAAVTMSVAQQNGDVVLTVADDGPGMRPEVVPHVFERFYRADAARSRARGGSGLGLSIADAIVRAHGGRIDVASAPGEGTAFTVRLSK